VVDFLSSVVKSPQRRRNYCQAGSKQPFFYLESTQIFWQRRFPLSFRAVEKGGFFSDGFGVMADFLFMRGPPSMPQS
jgi:hypothetical protein